MIPLIAVLKLRGKVNQSAASFWLQRSFSEHEVG
jgi:hypothetical protein